MDYDMIKSTPAHYFHVLRATVLLEGIRNTHLPTFMKKNKKCIPFSDQMCTLHLFAPHNKLYSHL